MLWISRKASSNLQLKCSLPHLQVRKPASFLCVFRSQSLQGRDISLPILHSNLDANSSLSHLGICLSSAFQFLVLHTTHLFFFSLTNFPHHHCYSFWKLFIWFFSQIPATSTVYMSGDRMTDGTYRYFLHSFT